MENLNTVNDVQQTVVESASGAVESVAKSGTPDMSENAVVTDRTQSADINSGFRKLRLENERLSKKLESMADYESLKSQNARYLETLARDSMARDLERIKRLDPSIKSLESLGGEFIRLIESGIDAKDAFYAVKGVSAGEQTPKPPRLGAVGFSESRGQRYFSSRELDRLSAKDLENPKTFKLAMESLKRL